MTVTHWTPPPPTPPSDDGPRAWSLAATALALVLPVVWLPILGALLGFAAWLWRGEDLAALLRLGALLGLAAGALISLGVLLSSSIFARAVHRPAVPPATAATTTVTITGVDGATDRIIATVTADGDRTAITLDGSL